MFKSYEEAEAWITGLTSFGIRPGLERIQAMMETLGNPQNRLKFIHVAGTNGKGSTCAMLTQALLACGYSVGTFTSPYIEKYTNRIQYNGEDIPEEDVLAYANQLHPIVEELAKGELGSPTMFEVTTALAILYFAKKTVPDYVVWETGLGGKQDVTNIVFPVVSVITNVGHDHMDILGDTIESIAMEKAGIIKSGVPVVSAAAQDEAVRVLDQTAASNKTTLYLLGRQFHYELIEMSEDKSVFRFNGPYYSYGPIEIPLTGEHQVKNAATAVMTLEILRQFNAAIIEEEDMLKGFNQVKWPGRFEKISDEPALVLDGAHNPEGAQMLADTLTRIYPDAKKHFMIGMLSNKNHQAYLEHILPIADTMIITEPAFRGSKDGAELMQIAQHVKETLASDAELIFEPDWKKAVQRLKESTRSGEVGIAAGSLYLIADVRSWCLKQSISDKGW